MDVSAVVGGSTSNFSYDFTPAPVAPVAAKAPAVPAPRAAVRPATPLSAAITDAPSPAPGAVIADVQHLPASVRYAPSPAPRGSAQTESTFESLA